MQIEFDDLQSLLLVKWQRWHCLPLSSSQELNKSCVLKAGLLSLNVSVPNCFVNQPKYVKQHKLFPCCLLFMSACPVISISIHSSMRDLQSSIFCFHCHIHAKQTTKNIYNSLHMSKNTQQPLALADMITISTLFLVVHISFQKKNHLHNVCFPQTVWTTGALCRFPAGKCFKLTSGNGPATNAALLYP